MVEPMVESDVSIKMHQSAKPLLTSVGLVSTEQGCVWGRGRGLAEHDVCLALVGIQGAHSRSSDTTRLVESSSDRRPPLHPLRGRLSGAPNGPSSAMRMLLMFLL